MKTIRLTDELVEQIDAARGLVSREAWVRHALALAVESDGALSAVPVAERPVVSSRVMSSPQARSFTPIPKGGK
jgi:2-C-methyl-D-erythritol 4-phosphate cytidylyltransferase